MTLFGRQSLLDRILKFTEKKNQIKINKECAVREDEILFSVELAVFQIPVGGLIFLPLFHACLN